MKHKLIKIIILFLCTITINFFVVDGSLANIIKQTEGQEQILYQARNRLFDNEKNIWQVILFKRVEEGKTKEINLRLVGFPDVVSFNHPEDLIISTLINPDRKAKDEFAEKAPSSNVGQYDVIEILPLLAQEKFINLLLPVKEKSLSIKIPYAVLLEWQEVANK